MKTTILATVSILAVLAATPVLADSVKTNATINGGVSTSGVKQDVKNAWDGLKKDTETAYEDIKGAFIDGKEGSKVSTFTVDSRKTATGMIGKPIYNGTGERVATVKDIILDSKGKASMVVVADGEFMGIDGKLAAFDYNLIANQNADGDIIAPLTEQTIDKVRAFSYEPKDASDKIRVIPNGGYSVTELLDGDLVDQKDEEVADVDNISFKNGRASQLIVSFDDVLGLGGKKAAMNYSDAKVIRDGDDLDFQLTANQTTQFENYKKTAAN